MIVDVINLIPVTLATLLIAFIPLWIYLLFYLIEKYNLQNGLRLMIFCLLTCVFPFVAGMVFYHLIFTIALNLFY